MKLVCNVNIVYGNLKSENSQEYAQNLNDIVRSWIRLRIICPLKLRGRKVWLNQVACSAVSTTTTQRRDKGERTQSKKGQRRYRWSVSSLSAGAYTKTVLVMVTLIHRCCCVHARFLGMETKILFPLLWYIRRERGFFRSTKGSVVKEDCGQSQERPTSIESLPNTASCLA